MRFLYLWSAAWWFVASSSAQNSAEIPFLFQDGLIWLDVSVAGQPAPFHFVLDSGAGESVLDAATARRIGLALRDRNPVSGVNGPTAASGADGFNGVVGGCELPRSILVLDLEPVSRLCHQRIDGLVGLDFFESRIVQIDFAAEKVRFLQRFNFTGTNGQLLRLMKRNDSVCLRAAVNRASPEWMRLDTGCDGGVHWVSASAKPNFWRTPRKTPVGSRENSPQVVGAEVQIGDECWFESQTCLHSRELFPGEHGLIGNGILSKFRVTIDLAGKRLALEKPNINRAGP